MVNTKKFFLNIFTAFIPSKRIRKKIRKRVLSTAGQLSFEHSIYGKIYYPTYNMSSTILSDEPEIYNKYGERMRTFFIRDVVLAHVPQYISKYFAFDRYNYALETHFYTHESMLETMGSPKHRFGMLIESEAIVPDDYKIFDWNKGLHKDFDAIFTYSERILDRIDNAKFLPYCAELWYGKDRAGCGGVLSGEAYVHKTRNISMVSSNKTMCDMHRFRTELAKKCKNDNLADTFGTFDGGPPLELISDSLTPYRYSIVIENSISSYYFTERLTNCFAAHTIPVYVGASKIGQFFNTDGIIQIHPKDLDGIDRILKQCCVEDYEQRLPAILDNYNRVLKYVNILDYLHEEYLASYGI